VDALADVVDGVRGKLPEVVEGVEVVGSDARVLPPVAEERHLGGAARAVLQAGELGALDLVGTLQVRGVEVLGCRHVLARQAVVVDGLPRADDVARLAHAATSHRRTVTSSSTSSKPTRTS